MNKTAIILAAGVGVAAVLAGCGSSPNSIGHDQAATNGQLDTYQRNQPIPVNNWSQYRQTLLDVEQAQVHGMATTSFFYNQGVAMPDSCPSIGFPVPATAELTNPSQVVSGPNNGNGVVAQAEPNGSYSGDTTGTYVVCIAPSGAKYIVLWEGVVRAYGAPAHWDSVQGVVLDGAPTVTVKTK